MSTLSVIGKMDASGIKTGAQAVKKDLNEIKKNAETTGKSLGEMLNQKNSTSNYRKQLAQLTKTLSDLEIQYRMMSDAEKSSAEGQAVAKKIAELTQRTSQYKDAILDVQQSIKNMASDTAQWDSISQFTGIISSGLQTMAGVAGLSKGTVEALTKALTTMRTIEAGLATITKVQNALQKQSALMQGVKRVQTLAATKATELQTAATVKSTVAQGAFNAIAKANPYVLLASAIIAVGTALAAFVKHSKKASDAEKERIKLAEQSAAAEKKRSDKIGEAVGSVLASYTMLQSQWRQMSSSSEKNEWLEANKTKLNELGFEIKNVNDADEVFIRNSAAVINALKLRAEATALQSLYEEEFANQYKKSLEIQAEADRKKQTSRFSTTTGSLPKELQQAGLGNEDLTYEWAGGQSGAGTYTLTPIGQEKWNKWVQDNADAAKEANKELANIILEDFNNATAEAAKAAAAIPQFNKNNNNGNKNVSKPQSTTATIEVKLTEGSLAAAQKQVSDLENKLKNIDAGDTAGVADLNAQLAEAKAEVERINVALYGVKETVKDINKEPLFDTGSLAEAEYHVAALKTALNNTAPNTDEFNDILSLLDIWKGKVDEIKKAYGDTEEAIEDTTVAQDGFYESMDNIKGFLGGLEGVADGVESIYDAWAGLGDALDEAENGFEAFTAVLNTVFTTLDSIVGIIEAVNTVMTVCRAITEAVTAAKKKEGAETIKNTALVEADAVAQGVDAGAKAAAASAGAGESVSSIPYVGPILAVAAIATVLAAVLAAMASAKNGFAFGGIVPGHSFTGDKIPINVNSGEMILNTGQQKRLFDILDGNTRYDAPAVGSGKVDFVIKGDQLHGVLKNYDKKTGRA